MSYYFKPHVHHVHINNEVTILDEISDRYILLSEKQSRLLEKYMKTGEENSLGTELKRAGLIWNKSGMSLSLSSASPEGIGLYSWSSNVIVPPLITTLFYLPESIFRIITVRKRLHLYGLHGCLQHCRNKLKSIQKKDYDYNKQIGNAEFFGQCIKCVSPFFPGKVKCLEFSLSLFDMLIARGIKAQLFIGIQRYDFLSHAWLEINNRVIADDENLKTKLTPIISVTL
ncbi:lasso peptide biosynthesis B2 protein [Salmonella enterica]|nr:lasso peptide biosynthesis B2 protein [Salmonella enterica]EEW8378762.1 lasso peptide biosynthesis B2 protein [Salmonella enterica]EJJ8280723.1 lasso peptide biosynthesis B2 protein [Salmonella enterica]EMD5224957.1 lasso peptide biosynthesis B2 protein [Salmonella enterica]